MSTQKLIRRLVLKGYQPKEVWDGEEIVPTPTEELMLKAVQCVENSIARFTRDGHVHQVYLKDGCVADRSGDPGFGQAAERADRR